MAEPQNFRIDISIMTLLKIVVVGLVLILLYINRQILLMLLVSMILASAMDPLVEWLYGKAKFPRGLSVILVYVVFLGLLGLVIYFLIPPMVEEFKQISGQVEDLRDKINTRTGYLTAVLNGLGFSRGLSALGQSISGFTADVFQKTLGVVNSLVQTVGVLVFTFYLISSENGMKNFIRSLVPYKHRAYAMNLTDKIQKSLGYWLLGQLVLSVMIFAMTFAGLYLLGVKYALALALLAGFLELIPYLGPFISAIPAVFVAFSESPTLAMFVIILYVVVQQLENYIIVPKVMGRTVGANPLVILLAILVGFQIAGLIGMIVAVPIVAATTAFLLDFREQREV